MKSKKYIKEFIDKCNDLEKINNETIGYQMQWLCNKFLMEYEEVKKARNIGVGSSRQSLVNLITDYNKKWKNIAFNINKHFENKHSVSIIKMNGFLEMLRTLDNQYAIFIIQHNIK